MYVNRAWCILYANKGNKATLEIIYVNIIKYMSAIPNLSHIIHCVLYVLYTVYTVCTLLAMTLANPQRIRMHAPHMAIVLQ